MSGNHNVTCATNINFIIFDLCTWTIIGNARRYHKIGDRSIPTKLKHSEFFNKFRRDVNPKRFKYI